jgi:Flp pilus assembly secretin CpaC
MSRSATWIAAAALVAASAGLAAADDLVVKFDQSQILKLPRPAAEIIIGNPSIADVSLQGNTMMVVTGKSFGLTNIIVLDNERNVVMDQRIMVRRDENRILHVYKASARNSYACTPQCNPTLTPGDEQKFFSDYRSLAESKIGFSEKAADGGGSSGAQ